MCTVGDGAIEGADSRQSQIYGGQNFLQRATAVQIPGTSKQYRNTRIQFIRKQRNLRETLVKLIWLVALVFPAFLRVSDLAFQ